MLPYLLKLLEINNFFNRLLLEHYYLEDLSLLTCIKDSKGYPLLD
jgi:hypothetical protein